jgi:thiamine pyrophosphate-dependent acetolactate synthase large subunit-like protein
MDRTRGDNYSLDRRKIVSALLTERDDLLVVTGLGAPSWDATAAGDRDLTFPLWGAMGGAAMMGLGLALAKPDRRVLVLTGDGECLMGLGAFATIAVQAPDNLAIAVLDNERYGETGMQETHTAANVDLAGMAKAAGFAETGTVFDEDAFKAAKNVLLQKQGPILYVIKIRAEGHPIVMPPKDGVVLKERFRAALA